MTRGQTIVGVGAVVLLLVSAAAAVAADVETSDARGSDGPPPRTARFTIGALIGSGYGWRDSYGDVNRDVAVSGGNWARLGHAIVEGGVLFPRARVFVLTGPRYQIITGTTDVYTFNFVAHARSHAFAWFSKVGWLLRSPEARLQPYVALSNGYGDIAQVVTLPFANCGPNQNQTCVDTVTSGPLFIGGGAGLRARLTPHLDAVLALESQLGLNADVLSDLLQGRGLEEHAFNLDINLGLAAAF